MGNLSSLVGNLVVRGFNAAVSRKDAAAKALLEKGLKYSAEHAKPKPVAREKPWRRHERTYEWSFDLKRR